MEEIIMNRLTVKQGVERSYKCIHALKARLQFLFTERKHLSTIKRRTMSTIDRSLFLTISGRVSLVVALVSPNPDEAAEIKVTTNFQQSASTRSLCTLGAAIKAANSAMAVDGCTAGAQGVMNMITLPAQSNV